MNKIYIVVDGIIVILSLLSGYVANKHGATTYYEWRAASVIMQKQL